MSGSSGNGTAEAAPAGAAERHEGQLQAAWLLRTLVVPRVQLDSDRGPLALALPPALASACYHGPRAPWSACYAGSLDALAMLDRALFMPVTLDAAEGGAALAGACGSGCIGVVRRLTRGPYWLGRAHALTTTRRRSSEPWRGGHTDVVRELGQQPWAAGDAEDRVWIEWAVGQACASDNSALIDVLAGPPYNALQHEGEEMDHHIWTACCHGNREALYALFRHRRLKAAGFLRMASLIYCVARNINY
eukprot:m51a1_g7997 hypothetical protein (248) ;mRNA; r:123886-124874